MGTEEKGMERRKRDGKEDATTKSHVGSIDSSGDSTRCSFRWPQCVSPTNVRTVKGFINRPCLHVVGCASLWGPTSPRRNPITWSHASMCARRS